MIVFAAVVPHPPASIPEIGGPEGQKALEKTLAAYEILRKGFEQADPDTVVVISPHAYMEPYGFIVNSRTKLKGDFSKFGLGEAEYQFKNNLNLVRKIRYACKVNDFPAFRHRSFLDHGALIPLLHLTKNFKPKVVHLSFSLMSYQQHFRYGEIVEKIFDDSQERIAIIASGDLSHRLSEKSPAGFSPLAEEFDHAVLRFLNDGDLASLMNLEKDVVAAAGECGLRSLIVLLGMLHEKKIVFQLLSYEAPFGIGYLVARMF